MNLNSWFKMKDDKFKKLIQSIDLEEPGADFTDNVMKMVKAQEEINLNPALLRVIKRELLAEPSINFTDNLMAQIQSAVSKTLEPIISKKVQIIVWSVIVAMLLVALVNSRYTFNHLQNSSYFSGLSLNLSGTAMGVVKTAGSVLPYLIPLSALLFLDYFFRGRRREGSPVG